MCEAAWQYVWRRRRKYGIVSIGGGSEKRNQWLKAAWHRQRRRNGVAAAAQLSAAAWRQRRRDISIARRRQLASARARAQICGCRTFVSV
jgi:hypothetical protein